MEIQRIGGLAKLTNLTHDYFCFVSTSSSPMNSTLVSHVEIAKDVTKEILRRNLIQTR